jgi:hypothetical protein
MKMNKICKLVAVALCSLQIASCSVGMALSGKDDPNLSLVKVGASRSVIESQLGEPKSVKVSRYNTICTYEYSFGDEPDKSRAFMHGTLDVLTLGIWEIAGTPIEGLRGNHYRTTIIYDNQDIATSIN